MMWQSGEHSKTQASNLLTRTVAGRECGCDTVQKGEKLSECTLMSGSVHRRARMTPEERMQAAKDLFSRAKYQPNLSAGQRNELRRIASNLVACNLLEARRRLTAK
jgi:hypothetical protein